MAYDKVVDSTQLDGIFTDIANAIRAKNGESVQYSLNDMAVAIGAITSASSGIIQTQTGRTEALSFGGADNLEASTNIQFNFIPDIITFYFDDFFFEDGTESYSNIFSLDLSKYTEGSMLQGIIIDSNGNMILLGIFVNGVNASILVTTLFGIDSAVTKSLNYIAYKFEDSIIPNAQGVLF